LIKKNFYKLIESILKKIIFFFKKTSNQNLVKSALTAIYRTHDNEKILLKINKQENFIVHAHEAISREIFINGSYDLNNLEKVISIIKGSNNLITLVDVGANIGSICIPAITRNLFENAIAIEPEINNYRLLMANIFINKLEKKITTHNIALTDKNDVILNLNTKPKLNNKGDFRIEENVSNNINLNDAGIVTIKGETLDKIAPNLRKENSLICMDTQGYEGVIFKGAKQNLQKKIPILLEFSPKLMKYYNSFDNFKLLFPYYSTFFNLNDKEPVPIKLNENTLKKLFNNLFSKSQLHGEFKIDAYTDLLII